MAIALDATSQKETVPTATTSTHSHTCTGSDRALLVSIFKFGSGDSVTGVTYNGVAMTQLGKVASDASGYTYLYGLANPATGANDIVCTSSASVEWFVSCASYTGVDQTTPFPDTEQQTSSAGTSFTSAITTSVNNSWLIQAGRSPGKTPIAGASTILRIGSSATYSSWLLDSDGARSTGSNGLAWSYAGSSTSYWVLTAMAPSATASGPANLKSLNTNLKANIKSINTNPIANVKSLNTNV